MLVLLLLLLSVEGLFLQPIEANFIVFTENPEKFMGTENKLKDLTILLREDGKVVIGGRNGIFKISVKDLKVEKSLQWFSSENERQACLIKGRLEEECQNYLLIYAETSMDTVLVCGTNAFRPLCRKYQEKLSNYEVIEEFSGEGLCPYSPYYPSTAKFINGELYAATFGQFSGDDPLIYRRPVRTKIGNYHQLNVAATDVLERTIRGRNELVIYVAFKTPDDFYGSAVCLFRLREIEKAFEGDFKFQKDKLSNWVPFPAQEVPTQRPGSCVKNSELSTEALQFAYQHYFMNENVESFLEEPVLTYTSDCHVTSFAVDTVKTVNEGKYDVLFLGTSCGKVIKTIYNPSNRIERIIVEEINIAHVNASITNLHIHNNTLMLLTQHDIYTVPTQRCEKNPKTCSHCVGLQDPYCAWDKTKMICTTVNEERNRNLIQNIKSGYDFECCSYDSAKELCSTSMFDRNNLAIAISIIYLMTTVFILFGVCFFVNKTNLKKCFNFLYRRKIKMIKSRY
ncbi:semaphorin-1A-like isoform X2 [Centruroides sculpturatus]|uniref:semaphorin-1A-like isoform X2 n=1 Tax=Centruroides sculpturatus TaxID=218467 RepID=UPI000C6E26F7|nr:semaphorin-1A-like isoform X2 [Centruroides sculpturatus]